MGQERLGAPAGLQPDQPERRELPHRHRAGPGPVGAGGDDQHVVVAEERQEVVRAGGQRELCEHGVELAALEAREQLPVVVELGQVDGDVGPAAAEGVEHVGEEPRAERGERPQTDRAEVAPLHRLEVRVRRGETCADRLGVAEEQLTRRRQRHRERPGGPLDELLADRPLERGDLLADRRLRVPEPGARAVEGALLGHRLERGEVPELDPEPAVGAKQPPVAHARRPLRRAGALRGRLCRRDGHRGRQKPAVPQTNRRAIGTARPPSRLHSDTCHGPESWRPPEIDPVGNGFQRLSTPFACDHDRSSGDKQSSSAGQAGRKSA